MAKTGVGDIRTRAKPYHYHCRTGGGQNVSIGRQHAGRTITGHVSQDTIAVELDDETLTIARTTNRSPWQLKAHRPHRKQA